MESYEDLLQKSSIFQDIPQKKYSCVLDCLGGVQKSCAAGTVLADGSESVKHAGIVLEGTVEEFLYDENGNQSMIRKFEKGDVFGAAMAVEDAMSSVLLRAGQNCTVLQLDFRKLLAQETLGCPYRLQMTSNLMREFARELLFFNAKVRILSQKRLRDKLKVYLQTLTPEEERFKRTAGDGERGLCYYLPYNRSELAEFLCVDRSALSRELCRMRDEGLIEFSGSRLWVREESLLI